VGGKNIIQLTDYSVLKFLAFLDKLKLNKTQELIGRPILKEVRARLEFLRDVGLDYLTLSRMTGKQHVMINWIFNNRLAPEAENVVGMLIRNMPAAVRMEEISSMRNLLQSVKNQVAEDIAHCGWDLMSENLQPYVNDWMEVNLQLEINADELDELENERIELNNEFNAAPARLEFELIENEYGDNGFDLEVDFAEGMFDRKRIEDAKAIFDDYLEGMILRREDSLPE
jgi:hypothetical protein